MPCPYFAGVNQRGKEDIAVIEVAEATQDEAQVYGKKPEYPAACCRDEGQGGGLFPWMMPRSLLPGSSFREGYCVLHSVETQHATSLRLFDQPVGADPYVRLVFFGGLGALERNPSLSQGIHKFRPSY